ncbi:hypothetical protein N7530_010768 [Penicillium desertorum]|uniref:Uncharacterized protein n=1 Tax=Penicillium desertorum TaxID=1303715 RepID=A0A9X0BGU6_9EURO|nr:hypothetical protein N7530_010768 [Penicillium desertorum]
MSIQSTTTTIIAPANDKVHDYAREMRNGTQKDDNNICAFCGFGPHPDVTYAYKDYSGNRVVTLGHGEIIVRAALPNGKTHTWMITSYYSPRGHSKLFGMQKLLEEQDISYNTRTKYLTNGNGDILGYADTSTGVPYLISPKEINYDPNEIDSDSDSDDDIGFINKVTAYEVHCRLGHASKARIASTL